MVAIAGLREVQQRLQHTLDVGRLEEVLPAHHLGDPLPRIVDHDGEVIGDADVLARQHDVAGGAGVHRDPAVLAGRSFAGLDEAQWSRRPLGCGKVQAPGERLAGRQPRRLVVGGERTAAIAFRRAVRGAHHRLEDLLAGLERAVDEAAAP